MGAGGEVRTIPSESVAQARAELGIDHVTTLGPETLGRLRDLLATDLIVLGSYAVLGDGPETTIRLDSRVQDVDAGEVIILQSVTGMRNDLAGLAIGAAAEIRSRFGLDVAAESMVSGAFPHGQEAARLYAEGVVRLAPSIRRGRGSSSKQAAIAEPDSPLVWIELADAWETLGYRNNAIAAAVRSKELSGGLGRELRLRIEGQYQVLAGLLNEAVDTFRSLWLVYPDNLEYGLALADAQVRAGLPEAALETVAELRSLPMPLSGDPRIDLAEANAAGNIGDSHRQASAAERVVEASQRIGSSVLEADGRLALGEGLRGTGDLDLALTELEAARRLVSGAGDPAGEATVAFSLALTHLALGDVESATLEAEACLATSRRVEARITEGNALNICSGQAVVLHRIAIMSKDGDWILREDEESLVHVLRVLGSRGARYRFGAPLDVRWHRGGWSSHLEFRDDALRVRTDFFTRPPRLSPDDLDRLWREQEGRDPPFIDAVTLIRMKRTNRERDYAVIGELARTLTEVEDQLRFSRSARDLAALAECHPEAVQRISAERPLLAALTAGREAVEAALDAERRAMIRENERRLEAYAEAGGAWAAAWPAVARDIEGLPLEQAHEIVTQRAESILPTQPEER